MLLLMSTSDKIRLVTSSGAAVHTHSSYMDADLSAGVMQNDTMAPGRLNTNISSATTTDIVGAPGSDVVRNVKTLHIRNTDGSLSCSVSVLHTDGTTTSTLHSELLLPGESLEYIEGIGFFKLKADTDPRLINVSVADQAIGASTTAYLTGSSLAIPQTLLKAGIVLRWQVSVGKSSAATATETIAIRFGTAATASDTARNSFTGDTETAAADEAIDTIQATIRGPIGASCVVEAFWMRDSNLNTTGFSNTTRKAQVRVATSAAFDITAATYVGLSIQTGASHSLTVRQVVSEMLIP